MTPLLTAYDRRRATALLLEATPTRLRAALRGERFAAQLSPGAAAELDGLLAAWEQRALGEMPLRDALLVDSERGPRAYALICAALTVERSPVPPALAIHLPAAPAAIEDLPSPLASEPALAALAARAQSEGLALAWQMRADSFPPPPDLRSLAPDPPKPFSAPPDFEPPTGWRRRAAASLAALGVGLLALPLLGGRIPESPAGLPLALLTAALMVGIRAGRAGVAGAACIWLVANLPGFRHGMAISSLWPALPLLAAGVALLGLDRRVRAMWGWLRRRGAAPRGPRQG